MSPVIFGCIICGYAVDGYTRSVTQSWLKEFRAIYSNHGGIFISGVGCYDDPGDGTWVAPPLPHMRWDDHGYTKQLRDQIPVMRQSPENNRHGYIVHNACWCLLQKVVEPNNIPLERLYRICSSLPFPIRGIGVSWGHDYGGLSIIDNQDYYPWEDRLMEQYSKSKAYQYARYNPYDVPELYKLLSISSQVDQNSEFRTNSNNCFSLLPWEIRETIAIYLSTRDIANLLISSKAFLPLLTSQTFWSSRFQTGRDRDFIFETRAKRPKDWIYLYQMTNNAQNPPGLKNRKRIWSLAQALVNLLCFQLVRYTDHCYAIPNLDPRWTVAADIKEDTVPNYSFKEGCRLFEKQSTYLPKDLVQIAFSVTEAGVTGYLAGIRFTSKDGSHICLGYIAKDKELYLDIATLKGFVLAMGPRGIQALQVINCDGRISRWFGCPSNSPVTERLVCSEVINALEIGLDGYKITSLSISGQELSHVSKSMPQNSSLRKVSLWYPAVPHSDLYLNDESFTGESPLTAGYQPLCWIQFGGPNGVYLRSLIEICVIRLGALCSIEFHYKTKTASPKIQKLGRRKLTSFSEIMRFPLDGPGGELIQSVEVSLIRLDGDNVYGFYRHGKLNSFKISTNRGRSMHFQPRESLAHPSSLTPLSIAAGTILTGFYASQHPEEGLVSLGAISEVIE
ncbi:hypothetical protein BGW36DRAFT_44910 [Talaromyces proteolyticus]|uniref:DUF7600 domain-containing protein n=1 Tax=Talaromyces proteolyticus TaxID=1131652 RepID=A0AAD4KIG2_9EURO|nr:uncharacterized protein BGW36DRAFT_44910 [Talaromyces proteolyticus]KAH8692355.1 hypothetical protein BGW36DRAFT_44910 [Talaromyces proteolyticus]